MNLRERILERIKSRNETLGDVLGKLSQDRKYYPTQFTPDETLDSFIEGIDVGLDSECWNWTKTGSPYGTFYVWRSVHKSHKVMFQLWNGLPVDYGKGGKSKVIRHTCNNKKCCNPNHLITGTQEQNLNDAFIAGNNSIYMVRDLLRRCECGKQYSPNNDYRKYCSNKCQKKFQTLDWIESSVVFIATGKKEFDGSSLTAEDFCNKYGYNVQSVRRACKRYFGKSIGKIWKNKTGLRIFQNTKNQKIYETLHST